MEHNEGNIISEDQISNWPFRKRGYLSPAQRMLNHLYPDVAEYSVPDRWMLEVDTDWVPNTDIIERKDSFIIRFDLPGVEPNALRITIHENILRLEGERRDEFENDKDAKHFWCERNNGTFARFIKLPESTDTEKISTELKNGVLKLSFNKKVSAMPREIKIS